MRGKETGICCLCGLKLRDSRERKGRGACAQNQSIKDAGSLGATLARSRTVQQMPGSRNELWFFGDYFSLGVLEFIGLIGILKGCWVFREKFIENTPKSLFIRGIRGREYRVKCMLTV